MSVTVYLMRHGVAADAVPGMTDADRALTPEGVRKTRRAAQGLQRMGVQPKVILSSPLRRAEETARFAAGELDGAPPVELFPPLGPGFQPAELVKQLRPHRAAGGILLVGHQPDLGELASYLLTGDPTAVPLPFRKAGVAAITLTSLPPRHFGALEWFVTPAQLRAIASSHK